MSNLLLTRWIGVDWGTSRLRAWAMNSEGTVLARSASDSGMGSLRPNDFEPALLALVAPWLREGCTIPVICCGMVGSRQGWLEAPYMAVPAAPVTGGDLTRVNSRDQRINVHIIPGIMQLQPADVMRGEETQIGGLLAQEPGFSGVVCLPGTHTKWARVRGGELVGFSTFMTGELFSLLAEQSVLRHSVGADGWDKGAFCEAVVSSLNEPERWAEKLFSLRARSLICDLSRTEARARLSGLLIGLELGGTTQYWQSHNVAILGTDALSLAYCDALETQGALCKRYDVEAMTLAGLNSAASQLLNSPHALEAVQDG
ncbi:MAG TPA: 2-dehydro-3-deoxygalactonokinase [Devosia sp.]|nr:2-dehydro-3-deoxygalactonokinase [Devosia sp.]